MYFAPVILLRYIVYRMYTYSIQITCGYQDQHHICNTHTGTKHKKSSPQVCSVLVCTIQHHQHRRTNIEYTKGRQSNQGNAFIPFPNLYNNMRGKPPLRNVVTGYTSLYYWYGDKPSLLRTCSGYSKVLYSFDMCYNKWLLKYARVWKISFLHYPLLVRRRFGYSCIRIRVTFIGYCYANVIIRVENTKWEGKMYLFVFLWKLFQVGRKFFE